MFSPLTFSLVSVAEAIAPADATCLSYIDAIKAEFGDKVLGAEINNIDAVIRVDRSIWAAVAATAKQRLGMASFGFLSGLDWMDNPVQTTRYENVWGSVEEETPAEEAPATTAVASDSATVDSAAAVSDSTTGASDATSAAGASSEASADSASAVAPAASPAGFQTGLAGGDTRFQVFARFYSPTQHRGLVVKADLDEADPQVDSIQKIYPGADWHERETWEMYGFWFSGHPHLRHIYLPGGFEGYPLRKDFPLLAREVKPWPGLTNVEPIAGEAEEGESA